MHQFQKMKIAQLLAWAIQLVTRLQTNGPFVTSGLADNFCNEAEKLIQELEK
jgi:hypothetical protein